MIDGARMLTPGVLDWGRRLIAMAPESIVEVRGWHLGPDFQPQSVMLGYGPEQEAKLLQGVNWMEDGYRLFDISSPSAQVRFGITGPTNESNCIFMTRTLFDRIGGFDKRFAMPGGGLVNLEFFARASAAASAVFTLLGEGTFHQEHGGAATGLALPELQRSLAIWDEECATLGCSTVTGTLQNSILAGHIPPQCRRFLFEEAPEGS